MEEAKIIIITVLDEFLCRTAVGATTHPFSIPKVTEVISKLLKQAKTLGSSSI